MITPENVAEAARDKEELDRLFFPLHRTLSEAYDCAQCLNFRKLMSPCIYKFDIPANAAHLSLSQDELKNTCLKRESVVAWSTKHFPCDFLAKNRECLLGGSKPAGCAKLTYTNEPERLESVYSVLSAAEVCPVAFEILEQLKRIYGFR